MIWLKRLSPVAVILIAWLAYSSYDKYREEKFTTQADRHALITAQIWAGTAAYRKDPTKYNAFKDSVLRANSLTASELEEFTKVLEGDIERQMYYSSRISSCVDSLCRIADSVRKVADMRVADSIKAASSVSATTPK